MKGLTRAQREGTAARGKAIDSGAELIAARSESQVVLSERGPTPDARADKGVDFGQATGEPRARRLMKIQRPINHKVFPQL